MDGSQCMNEWYKKRDGVGKVLSWEFNCILLALYFTIQTGIQVNGAVYIHQGTKIAPSDDT